MSNTFDMPNYRGVPAPLKITSTPEYQKAIGNAIDHQTAAAQWNNIIGDLLDAGNSLKHAKTYTTAQEQLIDSMKKAIGAGVGRASHERDFNRREYERARQVVSQMEQPEIRERIADPNSNSSGMALIQNERGAA